MNSVSEAPTFDKLYTTLTTEYPDHIPLLQVGRSPMDCPTSLGHTTFRMTV